MSGLNNCNFIGRLGKEPEVKYTQEGKPVATISLAISESYKDRNGQKVEQTEWVRIVFFGALAEISQKYLDKGSQIYVSGKMRTRKWTDNNGQVKYSTEIIGQELRMLGSKKDSEQDSNRVNVDMTQGTQSNNRADAINSFNPDTDNIPF